MKVEVEGKGKIDLPDKSDVNTLIKELGHHIDSVIVLNDGEPVPDDAEIEENEKYRVISVVSGG
ncbi:MAG: MoaD/ThiS family protein [Thermoplasmatota archaeon]